MRTTRHSTVSMPGASDARWAGAGNFGWPRLAALLMPAARWTPLSGSPRTSSQRSLRGCGWSLPAEGGHEDAGYDETARCGPRLGDSPGLGWQGRAGSLASRQRLCEPARCGNGDGGPRVSAPLAHGPAPTRDPGRNLAICAPRPRRRPRSAQVSPGSPGPVHAASPIRPGPHSTPDLASLRSSDDSERVSPTTST